MNLFFWHAIDVTIVVVLGIVAAYYIHNIYRLRQKKSE